MREATYKHSSRRMAAVQSPIIPIIGELSRATPGTISLGQGMVYYGPPAMARLSGFNDTHSYGPVEGITPLIAKITEKLQRDNNISVTSGSAVIVTAGANMGFLNALFAITDPGDEVIIPLPYYFNHEMAIRMLNCKPVLVPTDADYQPSIDGLEQAISPNTRAIVTISPNNPTGVVYPPATLQRINALCRRHGIYHISDEAYEYFTFDRATHFSPGSMEGAERHTISLFSMSKAYGFAGYRIGYMVIPEHLVSAVKKAQDTNLICPALVSQYAAIGALDAGPAYCREKLKVTARVRNKIIGQLESARFLCQYPQTDGAFYFFLRIMVDMDDMELAIRLIKEHQVAAVPGSAFGMQEGCFLRIAYGALEEETALEGINRLIDGLVSIRG